MTSNAVILALNAAGTPDGYGDVPAEGVVSWEGRQDAYLKRVRRRLVSGGQLVDDYRDMLIVQTPAVSLTQAVPGDDVAGSTVLVEDLRNPTAVLRRFRVVAVDHRAVGSPVDSLRLELDDEQAP